MTVAACLIVKNEGAVIARCLASLRGLVQAVVVVDTGSTDDTLEVLRGLDSPVPVHVHERPWKDFAHNRTEMLRLASPVADYLLLLDADHTVEGRLPELTADAYHVRLRTPSLEYTRILLVRSALPWRYEGVVHEFIVCEQAGPPPVLEGLVVHDHQDGGRRPPGWQPRWEQDAEVLERELERDPTNTRYVFYLARSYEDLANTRPDNPRAKVWRAKAVARYRQRSRLGGYADEAFYSLYRLGVLRLSEGDGVPLLVEAWQRCPHRWEPVYEAARWLNQKQRFQESYDLSRQALARPPEPSGLFVQPAVYDYLLLFEHSISAWWVGAYAESLRACDDLLAKRLPPAIVEAVRRNRVFAQQKVDEQPRVPAEPRREGSSGLPVVCLFGVEGVELRSLGPVPRYETDRLDCRCYPSDQSLDEILTRDRPNVLVTFGREADYPRLMAAPFDVRKRWIHYARADDLAEVGRGAFHCFLHGAVEPRKEVPKVTVFTPAYRSGDRIQRPWRSLLAQTWRDWEWVILDDSDDGGETFAMLSRLAEADYRVRVYRGRHSGVIGKVKKDTCLLGRGDYLVELDHDDELTPRVLEKVVAAFGKYPEVGFVYTDFAECFDNRSPVTYGPDWAHGYGSYRAETHGGVAYQVANAPNINPKTMRHIVGAPNHLRCWRRSTYLEIGGHSDGLHVADDYELMVRTFLHTRMARIPVLGYIQFRNAEGNAHRSRNQEIQRLVRYLSSWYDQRIHERFVALGVDDFVWQEGANTFGRLRQVPNPTPEPHCTILAEV